MSNNPKFLTDNNGVRVPYAYVNKFDRMRERNVKAIFRDALALRTALEKFVATSLSRLDEISGLRDKLGEKGNFSATSFDGLFRVTVRQKYVIVLDERVSKARDLMLDFVNSVLAKIKGSDARALRLIVDEAFRANNDGILSTGRILSLLRMDINNDSWREAKDILSDSLKPQKGKRYLVVEHRLSADHDFHSVRLDIADCWPVPSQCTALVPVAYYPTIGGAK